MCFACFHSPYCPYMSILLLECQLTHLWPTTIRCQLPSFVLLVIHLAQVQLNAETGRCNSSCRRFERSAEQTQSRSRPWRCCAIFGKPVQVSTNSTEQLFYILYIVDPLWKRQAFHVLKSWHRFFFESDMRYRVQHQAVAERVSCQTRVTALHFSISIIYDSGSLLKTHLWIWRCALNVLYALSRDYYYFLLISHHPFQLPFTRQRSHWARIRK